MQHGYGGTKSSKSIGAIQNSLLKNGFQVFNFDSPNSFGESDGEYKNARLGLHANDFEDVTNWVREQGWFTGKLLVSGHSMGGFASARYALRNFDMVDFAIPLAPVISGELSWAAKRRFYPEMFLKWAADGVMFSESKTLPGRIKEKPWEVMLEYLDHSLLTESVENPKMLLFGCEKDTSIPPEFIKIFFDTLLGDKEFHVLEGAPHSSMDKIHLDKISETIDSWLQEQIKNSD